MSGADELFVLIVVLPSGTKQRVAVHGNLDLLARAVRGLLSDLAAWELRGCPAETGIHCKLAGAQFLAASQSEFFIWEGEWKQTGPLTSV